MITERLSRGLVPAVALVLFAACGGTAAPKTASPDTITVVSWGGDYQTAMTKAWFDPYAASHPQTTILQDEPTDYATLQSMVQTGAVTWDMVDVENDFGLGATQDQLEPIDCSKVPCSELQPERFRTTGYRVPVMLWGLVLAYRTDAWNGVVPQGWADFFDLQRFPGKRAIRRSATGSGILEAALLADGVDPSALYPLDVDRALAKLTTIASQIIWWQDGQECPQMLADGDAVMALCYNGRVYSFQQAGDPIDVQWNGALIQADYLVIPKGSPHKDAAMDLIAYITSADHNGDLSDYIPYAPANADATDQVNPAMEPYLPSSYADETVARDDEWLSANRDTIAASFDAWLQAHAP